MVLETDISKLITLPKEKVLSSLTTPAIFSSDPAIATMAEIARSILEETLFAPEHRVDLGKSLEQIIAEQQNVSEKTCK